MGIFSYSHVIYFGVCMHKKNAIIIVAHGSEKSVATLALLLQRDFDLYLHWDFKNPIPDYLRNPEFKLNILEKRIGCLWGEFSLWESMFISAWQAYNINPKLMTFTIISANDIPLMVPAEMSNFLDQIEHSLVDTRGSDNLSRNAWADLTVPYGARVDINDGKTIREYNKLTGSKYDVFNIEDKFSEHIGSQWCTWTISDLIQLKVFMKKNKNVVKAMKSSLIADEMFTQYMFYKMGLKSDNYHRLIDFEKESAHPIEVTDEVAAKVLENNPNDYIFGRKYDYSKADFNSLYWKNITNEVTLSKIKDIWK